MYNHITIMGRLTAAPELKQTQSKISVTSFTVAVPRPYADKQTGERQTDFFSVIAWRSTAEFVCKHFGKGDTILIDGEMQSRKYTDKDGNQRTIWELQTRDARFTGAKAAAGGAQASGQAAAPAASPSGFAELENDSDLPF